MSVLKSMEPRLLHCTATPRIGYTGVMSQRDATRDVRAIRKVFDSWFYAMQDGDLDKLTALVTDDVLVKPPDAAPVEGKNALRQALGPFLEAYSETVDFDIQEVEVCGQLAFARILERAKVTPKSGGEASCMTGMHFTILRRQNNGKWLIARDISSLIADE